MLDAHMYGAQKALPSVSRVLSRHAGVERTFVQVERDSVDGELVVAYVVPDEGTAGPLRRALRLERQGALGGLTLHEPASDFVVAQLNRRETDFLHQEIFADCVYLRHGIALPSSAQVVDVGANIGMFALFVARNSPGARIVCVEPILELCGAIRANAAIHAADIRVHSCALGATPGTGELTFYRHNSVMSGRYGDAADDQATVRAYLTKDEQALDSARLDAVIAERMVSETRACEVATLSDLVRSEALSRIDLLKIDVEKAELDVIAGIDSETWSRVAQVVIEAHDVGDRLARVRSELERHGFSVSIEEDPRLANTGCVNVYGVRPGHASTPNAESSHAGPSFASRPTLAAELFAWANEMLAPSELPSRIVFLDALSDRGGDAVDERLLEQARRGAHVFYANEALRTDTERALGKLFGEILRLERVTADTDFFQAGGRSLTAIRLVVKVEDLFGGPVLTPDALFNSGRLREVARAIDEAIAGCTPS